MRMSDPFILVTGLADDSPLHEFGIKPGDAIMTVDGKDFDTIGEFAALTKENKDMVWQMFHVPSVRCRGRCSCAAGDIH